MQAPSPAPSKHIDTEQLRALLPPALHAWQLVCLRSTGSTNADLQQWLQQQPPTHAVRLCQADCQQAGRGRLGRTWQSRDGDSLTFSLAYNLPLPISSLAGLSLACGLALVEGLEAAGCPPGVQLKWPNDLLLQQRKLAGILIETHALRPQADSASPACWVIIGIGLNLRQDPALAEAIGQPPASLDTLLPDPPSTRILAHLLTALARVLNDFPQHGFAPFQGRWCERDAYAGQTVCVLENGQLVLTGIADGVDAQGRLCLITTAGRQTVYSGEVSLRPAPLA